MVTRLVVQPSGWNTKPPDPRIATVTHPIQRKDLKGIRVAETLSPEHQEFYERFQSFWAAPTGARVAELIAPHAEIHFTGEETMSGAAYIDWMANLLAGLPDLVVTPVDFAGSGDLIYIFWRAAATINGVHRKYYGVDRFRMENGMAIEEHVIFDSATLQGPVE